MNLSQSILSMSIALLSIGNTGCDSMRKRIDAIGTWAADPIIPAAGAHVDIASVIWRDHAVVKKEDVPYSIFLDAAIRDFEKLQEADYIKQRRMALERIKLSSDVLCAKYKVDLSTKQARGNFFLGELALLFGAAGAISTVTNTARGLSGAAAFSTGSRSELNQDFYLNQTFPIIVKAIEKQRLVLWQGISDKTNLSSSRYSISIALADVLSYHDSCSLNGALALAEKAITEFSVLQSQSDAASSAELIGRQRRAFPSELSASTPEPASSQPAK